MTIGCILSYYLLESVHGYIGTYEYSPRIKGTPFQGSCVIACLYDTCDGTKCRMFRVRFQPYPSEVRNFSAKPKANSTVADYL